MLDPKQATAARIAIARRKARDAALARFDRLPDAWAVLILLGLFAVLLPIVLVTGEV